MNEEKDTYTLEDLAPGSTALADISPPARLSVFGDPVAHSLSPQLHNPALKALSIDSRYIRVQVAERDFPKALALIQEKGFLGTNCTIPLKFAALGACDHVDDLALKLGVVNTISLEDGKIFGSNSDGPGFLRAVREAFAIDAHDLRIMILGAGGGAGRAVTVQCALEAPERLVLVNRTREKAESLRAEIAPMLEDEAIHSASSRVKVAEWSDAGLEAELGNIDLIVNATSLGMKRSDPALIQPHLLQPHHLVYDMVYSPQRTKLIADAQNNGARTANGLSMLLHQGAISFETWFNREAPLETMRNALQAALGAGDGPLI
ncbi:MAG: shikimate dehydrogenase [Verrucomicrobiaceae bacterium]|nr:shikimate dehydrogenase [Verrucomicrobiaceae bacterium]